jgi:hypothetical protein
MTHAKAQVAITSGFIGQADIAAQHQAAAAHQRGATTPAACTYKQAGMAQPGGAQALPHFARQA